MGDTPDQSWIHGEGNRTRVVRNAGHHLQIKSHAPWAVEGNSQRKPNLKVISNGGGLASAMSDPRNNKPHVATHGDLRLGRWRHQEYYQHRRCNTCKTPKHIFEHFSLLPFCFELVFFLKKRRPALGRRSTE